MGIAMFFDSRMLSFGNLLVIVGIVLLLGVPRAVAYLTGARKRKGAICFVVGIVLVLRRWTLTGFATELFGLLNLFADFSGVIVAFLRQLPLIGDVLNHPRIAPFVDRTASGQLLPV